MEAALPVVMQDRLGVRVASLQCSILRCDRRYFAVS
jgi:hypothetical protein